MISKAGRFSVLGVVAAGSVLAGCSDGQSGDSAADPVPAGTARLAAASQQLAALEARRERVQDAADIKRLQRIYGYYLDNGMWSEIADLFAANGSIEIGLDGVYAGRERIRSYLQALGNNLAGQAGHSATEGLADGQLNEHMQLMPVVTVAADGQTARGRWRDLMLLGNYGGAAYWGEGPYENEYVKEEGVWKLARVHWFQSMLVPYEGGWQVNEDSNGGHWVPASMTPDRPPTVEYETWPGTYLPPFHFPSPVLNAAAALTAASTAPPAQASLPQLAARAATLAQEIALLEDENEIENLQRIYGFYIEEGFWSEAASLFADDGTIEIGNSGVYVGRDRVLAYMRTWGDEFPRDGRLFDQMQLQPVVHVAPDGQTARGRWRLFAQEAEHGEFAHLGVGVYENRYVKVDGTWRIQSLHGFPKMYTTYEDGWASVALPDPGPSDVLPPDRPSTMSYDRYPARFIAPFHFEHPVNGQPVFEGRAADFAAAPVVDAQALMDQLAALEARVLRLEDFDALERMNAIYGYYLARNEWDNLAGIFSPDGTIEIAMRGVYVGADAVRRNLNLYGEPGIHHGLLHNHMQYQPVIHLAGDGLSARMRSRAFSIMGEHETYSMWMGGVYENLYVKEEGVWKLQTDQVFNTYFVPYALGWKDAPPRPPPGISDANPPDLPPSHPFEMYPTAFVPPFHYPNPVTGEPVVWEQNR